MDIEEIEVYKAPTIDIGDADPNIDWDDLVTEIRIAIRELRYGE